MAAYFKFNFNITMTYFLSPHFSFSMCDKHNVIISKVHNVSQPYFWKSGRMILRLSKWEMGTWEPARTPKPSEFDFRGPNTSH
jgi:hypothetical protein